MKFYGPSIDDDAVPQCLWQLSQFTQALFNILLVPSHPGSPIPTTAQLKYANAQLMHGTRHSIDAPSAHDFIGYTSILYILILNPKMRSAMRDLNGNVRFHAHLLASETQK